jgi:hypothetical protein
MKKNWNRKSSGFEDEAESSDESSQRNSETQRSFESLQNKSFEQERTSSVFSDNQSRSNSEMFDHNFYEALAAKRKEKLGKADTKSSFA